MNTVTMEWKRGEWETCRYLARDPKEADGKLRFYAETKAGWRVVTLEAVRPHGGRFADDAGNDMPSPFSDSPPKEITPCRLLSPPVYEDEETAKQNRPENWPDCLPHIPEDLWHWESVYQKTHGEALWPKLEHEGQPRGAKGTRKGGPIRNMLARIRWAARADRRRHLAAWERETRRRSETPLEQLKYTSEEQRQERVKEARQQIEAARNYWRQIEILTLADFKRGCWDGEGKSPLHSFLESDWAKRNAVDMAAMERDAAACREWINRHCWNVTRPVRHFESGLRGMLTFNRFIEYGGRNDAEGMNALLARVRYKVTCEDGKTFYLTDRRWRMPTDGETDEIENGKDREKEWAAAGRRWRIAPDFSHVEEKTAVGWTASRALTAIAQLGLRVLVAHAPTPQKKIKSDGFKDALAVLGEQIGHAYSVSEPSQVFRESGRRKPKYSFIGKDKMIRNGGGLWWLDMNSPAIGKDKKRTRKTR